jgi:outer membrane autotransporter protein
MRLSHAQAQLLQGSTDALAFSMADNFGSGAGDNIAYAGRLGLFVNGEFGRGDKDDTANESGFDIDSTSLTLGVDYLLENGSFVGVALGINTSESEMSNNGGSIESDGTSLTAYATNNLTETSFIDGSLGFGRFEYDTTRNIDYTASNVAVDQQALGSTEADLTFASIGVGTEGTVNQNASVLVSLSGRLNYLSA